jgi:predicted Rossmann-fold nucleotide-binding protein
LKHPLVVRCFNELSFRSRQLLTNQKPDLVVAFPGNSGTRHMVEITEKAGIKVLLISLDE